MTKSKIILHGLLHALAILAYIALVAYFLNHAPMLMINLSGPWAIVPFLLLLTFSVAVIALFIFGHPIYLFINGHKQESYRLLLWTLGFIFILMVAIFALFAFANPYSQHLIQTGMPMGPTGY